MSVVSFSVNSSDKGIRLDLLIVLKSNKLSRSQVREYLNLGKVKVDGEVEYRPQVRVAEGSLIEVIDIPDYREVDPTIIPQNIPLDIVYEDEDLLMVNKPAGMVTQPATGNWEGTLVNALLFHYKSMKDLQDPMRSGLINRIDKDTSGLVLVGKTSKGLWYYSKLFAQRQVQKTYLAIIIGNIDKSFPEDEVQISNFLGRNPRYRTKFSSVEESKGRYSETIIKIVKKFKYNSINAALVEAYPKTGRTHQIRVHLSSLGCPILGDKVYGKNNKYERMLLHAWKIKLKFLDGLTREIITPIPLEFKEIIDAQSNPKSNK